MTVQLLEDTEISAGGRTSTGGFAKLLGKRRTAKHIAGGELTPELIEQIARAVQLTPSAYNTPPWHVVLVSDRRDVFWDLMITATQKRLDGERLHRQLNRYELLREGAGIALIFERLCVERDIQVAWQLDARHARSFVDQAIGMVQLSIWLTLVEQGMSTSLQHWSWLAESEIAEFAGADPAEFRLVAVLPIGVPASEPAPIDRSSIEQGFSLEQIA